MDRVFRRGSIWMAALIWVAILTGCGTVKSAYQGIAQKSHDAVRWYKSPGDDLVKRVGVTWLANRSGYTAADFEATYTVGLVDRLRAQSDTLTAVGPADPGAADLLGRLPQTPEGLIDNLELALAAREIGLNAVVIASLVDVRDRRQEKGVWWFKDVYDDIEVTINVEVYDSLTAAKLLDERFTRQFEADIPLSLPGQAPTTALPPQVLEEIEALLEPVARRITDVVAILPWVGYIHEVSGDRITLASCGEAGLEAGDVLDVLDNQRVIQGMENAHFFLPGLKTGEIEVTSVSAGQVEARILSGTRILAGSPVKRPAD